MIDSLVQQWKPVHEIEIPVNASTVWKARPPQTVGEQRALEEACRAKASLWPLEGSERASAAPYKDWPRLPQTLQEAFYAAYIQSSVVEPELSDRDALHLLEAPNLVRFLIDCIERGAKDARFVLLGQQIEAEKKDSPGPDPAIDNSAPLSETSTGEVSTS